MADTEIASVFSESGVLCGTEIADGRELIGKLVGMLAPRLGDPDNVLAAVLEREEASPTFISPRVAMPHARLSGIDKTAVAIATSKGGVHFPGSETAANLVILVLTPQRAPIAYLRVAASVTRGLRTEGFLDGLLECRTAGDVRAYFSGESRHEQQGFVSARDMMEPPKAILTETNSVKDAIDLIVRTGLSELPVVDKEGDMVGVASASAILGLCLPEYMLWMEDLSPFSNFEPFETLLRRESSTWLADITDDDYAHVSADQPAIAIAEAMARHKSDRCFVLDGAKLAGEVTLPRFLHNVFRD